MTDIEKQITDAVLHRALDPKQIRRLPPEESARIVQTAQQNFVEGRPRAWWLSLKIPSNSIDYADAEGFRHIGEHWRSDNTSCWFIPETEEQDLAVYETNIQVLPSILEECSFFEYYILSKDFKFLLIENDHNQVITAQIQ